MWNLKTLQSAHAIAIIHKRTLEPKVSFYAPSNAQANPLLPVQEDHPSQQIHPNTLCLQRLCHHPSSRRNAMLVCPCLCPSNHNLRSGRKLVDVAIGKSGTVSFVMNGAWAKRLQEEVPYLGENRWYKLMSPPLTMIPNTVTTTTRPKRYASRKIGLVMPWGFEKPKWMPAT